MKAHTSILKISILQMAICDELEQNRDKILRYIEEGSRRGCRVVLFPEGALNWPPEETEIGRVDEAIAVIKRAAAENQIYVFFGLKYKDRPDQEPYNRMYVVGPEGKEILCYNKVSNIGGKNPEPLYVDGIPCHVIICADRWYSDVRELPVMRGSRIIFELANGGSNGWFDRLAWFRYVPWALRNNVYVVVCNSSRMPTWYTHLWPAHGHCTVIDPAGNLVLKNNRELDRFDTVTLDLSLSTGREAARRRNHPLFKPFWDRGIEIVEGRAVTESPYRPLVSSETEVTVAAVQMGSVRDPEKNAERMASWIGEASARGAEVVVFPELALTGALEEDIDALNADRIEKLLGQIRRETAKRGVSAIVGSPFWVNGKPTNSAFVLGPEGEILTRYDRIVGNGSDRFTSGSSTEAMWFKVKGIWSVVTVGADALWNEIAELAAIRGAQLHCHICYDHDSSSDAVLLRMQRWIQIAQYRTLTVTVNATYPTSLDEPSLPANGGSAIWDDLAREKTDPGNVDLFMPYHANLVVQADDAETVLYARRKVNETNPHFDVRVGRRQTDMRDWFLKGAEIVASSLQERSSS